MTLRFPACTTALGGARWQEPSRFSATVVACAALSAAASLAPSARAEEAAREARSTIAVLCAPGDRLGLRIQAELEALGFRTVLLDPATEPASRASLEASAREAGAIAAIRAVSSERGVEVWVADRITGKTVLREIAGADGSPDRDAALALSAVDLLRASFLEIALPAPPPGEVPATPEIRDEIRGNMALPTPGAIAAEPPPMLRLSLASGVLLSPGGFGAAASLDVGLAWMPSGPVGVSGFASIPLTRPRVEGAHGSAALSVLLAGGGARFLFTTGAGRWAPSAELGVMAVSLESAGRADAGFVAKTASAVTAAPFTRVGVAFAPIPMLRLRADILVSAVGEGVSIQVADREIATWGRPIVLPSIGIDAGWF